MKHLVSRNATEWNANSGYVLLMAHAKGAAQKKIDDIRRDETKHIAIFSGAYKYVFGTQAVARIQQMLKKIITEFKYEKANRTEGNPLNGENLVLFEGALAHIAVEMNVQKYYKSVPLRTLQKLFEIPETSDLNDNPDLSADMKEKILQIAKVEKQKRLSLARWGAKEREAQQQQRAYEKQHENSLLQAIQSDLRMFTGAEVPDSPGDQLVKIDIRKISRNFPMPSRAETCFLEMLRDYQIMNNTTVREKNIKTRLKNLTEGFVIDKVQINTAVLKTQIMSYQPLTESTALIRFERPEGFNFKPGQAIQITIPTSRGNLTRTLSLASSPLRDHIDVAVRLSDSDFKKAFQELRANDPIEIVGPTGVLNYNPEKPAVMIAGGIGITPFRSILEQRLDQKNNNPHWLIYANQSVKDVPFAKDFEQLAQVDPAFKYSNVFSEKGERIDKNYLENQLREVPSDAVFYIVGPPAMVKEVRENLLSLGVPETRISVENFAGYK